MLATIAASPRLVPVVLILAASPVGDPARSRPTLSGFTPARAAAQLRAREGASTPSSRPRTCAPGCTGSPRGRTTSARPTARTTPSSSPGCSRRGATTWRSTEYQVLLPDADRCASVELVAPTKFMRVADRAAAQGGRDLEPDRGAAAAVYNAYSIDGDVTGELVYVNYGVPADYEELERRGIDVQGQDRHRALRRIVARHQAEGRRRARRHRLPDLLGSARGRLLPGRRLSDGRLAQRSRARSAAR